MSLTGFRKTAVDLGNKSHVFFCESLANPFWKESIPWLQVFINIFRKFELFTWLCLQMFTLLVNSHDNNTKKKKTSSHS